MATSSVTERGESSIINFYYGEGERRPASDAKMEVKGLYSHSPRPSFPRVYAFDPTTPVHSPQNSLHSATSSRTRTPLHHLTLHEYRKQQSTPTPPTATPPGKALRRKIAASALNELERVPSINRTPVADTRPFRPLHFSRSAFQLNSHHTLPPSPPDVFPPERGIETPLRAQSAEPRSLRAGNSGASRANQFRVSNWKPIKRLPKPTQPPLPTSPTHTVSFGVGGGNRGGAREGQNYDTVPFAPGSPSSTDNLLSSGVYTEESTFSLSRFPDPPFHFDAPISPPNDENAPLRLNTTYATAAPVTPPATPAVIHYRGTSFDLVNPHDSLLFHDIVTPSRDLDSTDYLPLGSSEDAFLPSEVEMAQRGRRFEDFSSAFNSIAKREADPSTPNLRAPPPAVLSPDSSYYSSPEQRHDSKLKLSSAVQKSPNESRFSIKQFTPLKQLKRTFTRKSANAPQANEEELLELQEARTPVATPTLEGEFPRSLHDSYRVEPTSSPFSDEYRADDSDEDEALDRDFDVQQSYESSDNYGIYPRERFSSAPLTSMVPDVSSIELGRAANARLSVSASEIGGNPYYEDSIYPSSSVYDREPDDGCGYPPSLYTQRDSRRISRPLAALNYTDEDIFPGGHNRASFQSSSNAQIRNSYRQSGSLEQTMFHSPMNPNDKTDTISKIIEQYDEDNDADNVRSASAAQHPSMQRGFSQFDFSLHGGDRGQGRISLVQPVGGARKATLMPGSAPRVVAPLAPAFESDEEPEMFKQVDTSDVFSTVTYGDTRQLLQLYQPNVRDSSGIKPFGPTKHLEPSSSYSQSDDQANLPTPEEALVQAEQIFEAAEEKGKSDIPAMWSRSGSDNRLRNRTSTVLDEPEDEQGDWETVREDSRQVRISTGSSIANYSSSENSGSTLALSEGNSLPALPSQAIERDTSVYHHPSPLPAHEHPFSSSPPPLSLHTSARSAPLGQHYPEVASSPQSSSTTPIFRYDSGNRSIKLWPVAAAIPYELSDKETQELLASGPNDEIIYGASYDDALPSSSDQLDSVNTSASKDHSHMKRRNSFEKFSILSPMGNLTGTPKGSGMHAAGSSIADTSSPGAKWSSSPAERRSRRASGFYIEPHRMSSHTKIRQTRQVAAAIDGHERSPSQVTLFPSHYQMASLPDNPPPLSGRPRSRSSRSIKSSGGHGRAAVAGQTKLREMVLASDAQTASSSHSTHYSQFIAMGTADRPSSSNTQTPLRGVFAPPQPILLGLRAGPIASEHSPHLLCPERASDPADEAERRKLSWIIFAMFCLFPPAIILYRWFADYIMVELTHGRLGHCAPLPKRIATYTGIAVNFGTSIAIVVPIVVMHVKGVL